MKFALLLVCAMAVLAAEYPSASITNGIVTMGFYLPDPVNGSYRGTRFDWSGIAHTIRYGGHEFAGVWYEKHDPVIHDALTGPVEEFLSPPETSPGYAETPAGGTFMRIGVGLLVKPEGETAFKRFSTYKIADPGKRSFSKTKDSATFTHELAAPELGYAYRYTKTIRLMPGKAQFTIEHRLENTGKKPIDTQQYNHNFLVFDNATVGPGVRVIFPFEPKPREDLKGKAEVRGKELVYLQDLQPGGESVATEFDGFGPSARDYDFKVENARAGLGVRIKGDQPLQRVYYWSIRTVACPEPYIHIQADPGQTATWSITYDLYEIKR